VELDALNYDNVQQVPHGNRKLLFKYFR